MTNIGVCAARTIVGRMPLEIQFIKMGLRGQQSMDFLDSSGFTGQLDHPGSIGGLAMEPGAAPGAAQLMIMVIGRTNLPMTASSSNVPC